jgi:glycosyltransferase involved in cell wall biosynthesis
MTLPIAGDSAVVAPADAAPQRGTELAELIVCSLKEWNDVWNRNNFLTAALLKRNPRLRVLFVEPPVDPLHEISKGKFPSLPALRTVSVDGRLRVLRPLKLLPRRLGPLADALLRRQVLLTAKAMRLVRPTLWINDVTYAPLIQRTGWPSVYDVSDDWLLAPFPARELDRLRRLDRLAMQSADEVVVCSPGLVDSRGAARPVTLVRNAVDAEHFRRPRSRPVDLPRAPVVVYVGTAHDARIDVDLVVELATALPHVQVALVGPDALRADSRGRLESAPNVHLLGTRPYRDVPAYLQHADVVIVPHLVSPFMESLDPIKAYECLAIDTPTLATPVAGFRELGEILHVAPREAFVARLAQVLSQSEAERSSAPVSPPTWEERARTFESVLVRSARARRRAG